jgi:hypothetical protein
MNVILKLSQVNYTMPPFTFPTPPPIHDPQTKGIEYPTEATATDTANVTNVTINQLQGQQEIIGHKGMAGEVNKCVYA